MRSLRNKPMKGAIAHFEEMLKDIEKHFDDSVR
jgi:hypothetical protein